MSPGLVVGRISRAQQGMVFRRRIVLDTCVYYVLVAPRHGPPGAGASGGTIREWEVIELNVKNRQRMFTEEVRYGIDWTGLDCSLLANP